MVLVVGGGPAGLATAAALRMAGVDAQVLERGSEIGASWMAHYDRLHLHTVRWLSALPGLPIPETYGPWVARDDVVQYLRAFAAHHRLDVRFGIDVDRIDPGVRLSTSAGAMEAERVIVATGYNAVPVVPVWPGPSPCPVLHASTYTNGRAYRGKDVLVVGAGNTGAEIAVDLVEHGAAQVRLAVRTPPNVLPRSVAGIPTQALAVALRGFPDRFVDALGNAMSRIFVGDLSSHGLAPSPRGPFTRATTDKRIPILDVGFVDCLRRGQIGIVGAVERFESPHVVLVDGARLRPDAIIAATGYRRGLEPLVGHLGLLDGRGDPVVRGPVTHPEAPGIHFIGFTSPVTGNLRAIANDARAIARSIGK